MGGKVRLLFKYWFLCCLSLCLVPLILGTSSPVYAQEEDVEEFMLEEIVVTAEKREAEIQKIPIDISVVKIEDMTRLDVHQIYDIEKILPDVSTQSQVGTFILVSIREVETGLWNPMFETTVAMHMDGIQLTRFGGADNMFFDLERMEVLKGPQGTLYGRGSTAGSMNIISRKPVMNEFSGRASQQFGTYGQSRSDLAINIPLTDTLAMRVAGLRNKMEGYSDVGYGNSNSRAGRLSLRWEPGDRTTLTLIGDWEKFETEGYSMFGDEGYYFDTYGGTINIVENTAEPNPSHWTKGGPVRARFESKWVLGDGLENNFNDNDHYGVTGIFEHEFDIATGTVTFGHRSMFEEKNFMWGAATLYPQYTMMATPWGNFPVITDPGPPYHNVTVRIMEPYLFVQTATSSDTDTIELRLTSKTNIPAGDKVEWILGIMSQDDKVTEETFTLGFAGGTFTGPPYFVRVDTKSTGAFAQGSYTPFDKWNFTGGFRMNWDKKDYMGIMPFDVIEDPPLSGNYVIDRDFTQMNYTSNRWSEPNYKFNVSYLPTDDIMAYLQFSKGYRTGNVDFDGRAAPPEFLNAFEFGWKSRFFNNRLQVNAGLYYYDYKNYNRWGGVSSCIRDTDDGLMPYGLAVPGDHYCDDVNTAAGAFNPFIEGVPDGTVNNADYTDVVGYVSASPGGAEQKGISVNIMWLITSNDTLSVNGTWRSNKYSDDYNWRNALLALYPDADSPYRDYDDESGREFGGAPIRGNLTYMRTFRFGGGDILSAFGTLFYNGDGIDIHVNYGDPEHYTMPGRKAYWTGDVAFSYLSSKGLPPGMFWNIRFACSNVWDNDALTSISYTDDGGWGSGENVYELGSGTITGRYINPRTYSITFGIDW
ncbi:MAG: hypothetical protein AMJ79_14490 [Phycisphaerae bacterium SM23_30]|nr:MAG: hypothetical protein AMJ79_14490 [Phycisphaerae bacterium SM23_30]